jgi:hypothetical protein
MAMGGWIHILCVAHELQLVVRAALNIIDDDHLSQLRGLMKYFRTTKGARELNQQQLLLQKEDTTVPIIQMRLDMPTRWDSTHLMIKTALRSKVAINCVCATGKLAKLDLFDDECRPPDDPDTEIKEIIAKRSGVDSVAEAVNLSIAPLAPFPIAVPLMPDSDSELDSKGEKKRGGSPTPPAFASSSSLSSLSLSSSSSASSSSSSRVESIYDHSSGTRTKVTLKALSDIEWDMWTEIESILKPFACVTTLLCGDTYMTASLAYPYLLKIRRTIEKHSSITKNRMIREMCAVMISQFTSRWFFTTELETHFLVNSYLDIRFRDKLPFDLLRLAKSHIISQANILPSSRSSSSLSLSSSSSSSSSLSLSSSAVTSVLTKDGERWEDDWSDDDETKNPISTPKMTPIEVQMEWYQSHREPAKDANKNWVDASAFMYRYRETIPLLFELHRKWGSMPATEATCERVFSAAGRICSDERTRLSDDRLEALVCCEQNWNRLALWRRIRKSAPYFTLFKKE